MKNDETSSESENVLSVELDFTRPESLSIAIRSVLLESLTREEAILFLETVQELVDEEDLEVYLEAIERELLRCTLEELWPTEAQSP